MKIGVCGIACEICPKRVAGKCPNGEGGCQPKQNEFCKIASCAHIKGVTHCFRCSEFPCEITKEGPMKYGYCEYIGGKN